MNSTNFYGAMLPIATIVLSLVAVPAAAEQRGEQPALIEKKLEPKMRVVDRNWDYFKTIPCEEVSNVALQSRSEQKFLTRRKNECLNKYRAFFAKPVKP